MLDKTRTIPGTLCPVGCAKPRCSTHGHVVSRCGPCNYPTLRGGEAIAHPYCKPKGRSAARKARSRSSARKAITRPAVEKPDPFDLLVKQVTARVEAEKPPSNETLCLHAALKATRILIAGRKVPSRCDKCDLFNEGYEAAKNAIPKVDLDKGDVEGYLYRTAEGAIRTKIADERSLTGKRNRTAPRKSAPSGIAALRETVKDTGPTHREYHAHVASLPEAERLAIQSAASEHRKQHAARLQSLDSLANEQLIGCEETPTLRARTHRDAENDTRDDQIDAQTVGSVLTAAERKRLEEVLSEELSLRELARTDGVCLSAVQRERDALVETVRARARIRRPVARTSTLTVH